MGDEPTTVETRAGRIKRTWHEGEPERAARRAEWEAVGLLRRMGHRVAYVGWRLLLSLTVLAVLELPAVVVGAFVDLGTGAKVGGATIGIVLIAAVIVLSVGTDHSGDW